MDALMTVGAWVEAGESYDLMDTSSSLYGMVYGIWFQPEVDEVVNLLKLRLKDCFGDVQRLFYADKLLAASYLIPAIKEWFRSNDQFYPRVSEIVGLAECYAELMSDSAPITPSLQCCFYTLWQGQTGDEMRRGAQELERWFQPVAFPDLTLQFVHDLLKALRQVSGLPPLRAQFLKEFMGLGKAYGNLNLWAAAEMKGGTFLDTLWSVMRLRTSGAFRMEEHQEWLERGYARGVTQIEEALRGVDDSVRVMRLVRQVLEALKWSALPSGLKASRKGLHELMTWAWTYGALNPTKLADYRREGFFLDTLWRIPTGESAIPQAAVQMTEFVAGSEQPDRLFAFARRLLKTVKHTPAVRRKQKTASFLKAQVYLGREYGLLNPVVAGGETETHLFLDTVWRVQNQEEMKTGIREFAGFLAQVKDPTKMLKLDLNMLRGAKNTDGLEQEVRQVNFLDEFFGMGKSYVALKLRKIPETVDFSKFFLDTWWWKGNQDAAKGTDELKIFFSKCSDSSQKLSLVRTSNHLLMAMSAANSATSSPFPRWVIGVGDNPFRYQNPLFDAAALLLPDKFDLAGYQLLSHWMYGNGEPVYINNNSFWSDYMMRENQYTRPEVNDSFLLTIRDHIKEIARNFRDSSASIGGITDSISPLNLANGFAPIAYMYLHGVAPALGIFGSATRQAYNELDYKITLNLAYTWVDEINPNSTYGFKEWFASQIIGRAVTLLGSTLTVLDRGKPVSANINPTDYHIEIQWTAEATYEMVNGLETFKGWPFTAEVGFVG
jgi:hypothetical protein